MYKQQSLIIQTRRNKQSEPCCAKNCSPGKYLLYMKMRREIKRRRTIIFIAAALFVLLSVGVYASVPKGVAQINLITAEGEHVTGTLEIYVDTETQLSCKVLPETFATRTVKYSIADEQIATVDEKGILKALKEGETLLTVECGGTRQNYTVKAETAVEDITGLDKEVTLYEGEELQLEPKIKMTEKGLEKPETIYKVKRITIAKVDRNGLVTALKEGETTITVTAGDVTKKIKVIVEAAPDETYTPAVTAADDNDDDDGNNKAAKKATKKKTGGNTGGDGGNTGGNTGGDGGNTGGNTGGDGGNTGGNTGGDGGNTGGGNGGNTGGNTGGGSTEASE